MESRIEAGKRVRPLIWTVLAIVTVVAAVEFLWFFVYRGPARMAAATEAERSKLVGNGKWIGLALSYPETGVYPRAKDVMGVIARFANEHGQDASISKGFVYLADGQKTKDYGGGPGLAIIGYIPGPGGRVILYGDGCPKWQSDK